MRLIGLLGLVVLGACSAAPDVEPEALPEPEPEQVEVQVEVTPEVCLDALQDAETLVGLQDNAILLASEGLTAIAGLDFDGLDGVTGRIEALGPEIRDARAAWELSSAVCRRAGG